jgi:hypothetical protein
MNNMKTRNITLAAALCGTLGLMAQSNQISLGADLGLPIGDLGKEYTFLVGPTAGFELPIGDKLALTLHVSYLLPQAKSDFKEVLSSASLIPAQLGLKYFFQESQKGLYGHAQAGIHAFSESFKDYDETVNGVTVHFDGLSETQTLMSFAIGAGYQLDKFDIGLRYNMILPEADAEEAGAEAEAKSYIGLRVAYLLSLGN